MAEPARGGWHLPYVTATLVAAVTATAIRFGVLHHELPLVIAYRYGFSGRALISGQWGTVLTSVVLTRNWFMTASIVVSLAVMLGGYEVRVGSARAGAVALASAVIAPVAVGAGLGVGSALGTGFAQRAVSTLDFGASTVTAGGGGALVADLGVRRLRAAAALFLLVGLVAHHQMADWEHLVAAPLGYGMAHGFARRAAATRRLGRRPPTFSGGRAWPAVAGAGVLILVLAGLGQVGSTLPVPPGPGSDPSALAAARSSNGTPSLARLLDLRYPTPSIGGDRAVLVLLPAGYDTNSSRYPVIEVLHGRPGNPADIFSLLDLSSLAAPRPPFIAVVPDGHGPVVSDGDFADTSRQRLGAALSGDLRRWVANTYRIDGRWAVAGLSAGGYGAAYLGSRDPGAYQLVCPLSGYFSARPPAFEGEPPAVRAAASPIAHTSADGPETLLVVGKADAAGMAEAQQYLAALRRSGQRAQMQVVPGGHEWSVWKSGLGLCLDRFLSP
jgi:predicted esterase